MGCGPWTDAYLDEMRGVGDPPADEAVRDVLASGGPQELRHILYQLRRNADPVPSELPVGVRALFDDSGIDRDLLPSVARGEDLFYEHGPGVLLALVCYSLPMSYAARKGVKVLRTTGYLESDANRRATETCQMVVDVFKRGGLADPTGRGIRTCQKVRLMHATIRQMILGRDTPRWDTAADGVPINQEDLAGTFGTFTVLVVQGLEHMGIEVPDDQRKGWLDAWRIVGRLLGIREALIPDTYAAAEELTARVHARQLHPSADSQAMVEPLLAALDRNSRLKGRSASVVRFFMADHIHLADGMGVPRRPFRDRRIALMLGNLDKVQRLRVFKRYFVGLLEALLAAKLDGHRAEFEIPPELKREWALEESVP